jgi:hypothetical protein
MVLSTANICDFGWKARDFALKGVDGKTYSLVDVRGPKAHPDPLSRVGRLRAVPLTRYQMERTGGCG